MNRDKYILLVLLAPLIIGIATLIAPDEVAGKVQIIGLYLTIIVYFPVIAILRFRYIKMTWKEILLSFIPFYGLKYRFKRFTKK